MPIYEYHCTGCGKDFEFMQKFSDPPKTHCPECGGELKKLISQCSFHLMGTGWYATDYANKNTTHSPKKKHHKETDAKSDKKENKAEKPKNP